MPASMKFMFISAPKKAATPTNAPTIRPTPIASSPKTITLANQTRGVVVDQDLQEATRNQS